MSKDIQNDFIDFSEQLTSSQLSEYSKRIGMAVDLNTVNINQQADPLAFLNEIHARHMQYFTWGLVNMVHNETAFEGPPPVDLATIFQRLVIERREGYCLDINRLSLAVLQKIGVDAWEFAGTVVISPTWPRDEFNHLGTCFQLDGKTYLFETGIASSTPPAILPLDQDCTTKEWELKKITKTHWSYSKRIYDKMMEIMIFDDTRKPLNLEQIRDFNILHTDKKGPFSHALWIVRGNFILTNEHLVTPSGTKEINCLDDFKRELRIHFGIDLAPQVKLNRCSIFWL